MRRRRDFTPACVFALAAITIAGCSPGPANVFQGYIEGEYVYVAAPLGGALTNLAVARGDEVKTGQLLYELERGSEAAAVQQAEKISLRPKPALFSRKPPMPAACNCATASWRWFPPRNSTRPGPSAMLTSQGLMRKVPH